MPDTVNRIRQPIIGRPTTCTDEVIERIGDAVRAGNFFDVAAAYAGINRTQALKWMQHGRALRTRRIALLDANEPLPELTYYEQQVLSLCDVTERARAEAQARNVTHISVAARTDWRAAAWFLERTERRFQKADQIEVSGRDGGPIETTVTDARTELTSRIDRIAERIREARSPEGAN
jgi:hypothetical protein